MDETTTAIVPLETSTEVETVPSPGAITPRAAANQVAAQVCSIMDVIAERMALQSPHPKTARKVRGARTVPRDFVVGLTALVEWMPDLQCPELGMYYDTAKAHAVLESTDSYKQVVERTTLLLASMKYTNEALWAEVVNAAMATFMFARAKARLPGNAELAARVESLGRLLGRRGVKKTKKTEKKAASTP